MELICQKAIDRIEKRRVDDQNLSDCIKYRVCPKCGEDLAAETIWKVHFLKCENKDCDFTFSE
jgi:predicted  nucleic acid-binding Zn ribbon protein